MCLHIKHHNERGITLLFAQHYEQGIIIFTSNMFFFTCGVALTGYSVVTYTGSPIENMEMIVSSVEMHKLNATDKELPIQFCGERENGTRNVAVSLLLAAKDTNEQIFRRQFIAIRAPHVHQHIK